MSTAARQSLLNYRPARGEPCELACWDHTKDGWKATTITGTFSGESDIWIHIKKDGAHLTFLRSRWEYVIA